jgi:hypothetical protein
LEKYKILLFNGPDPSADSTCYRLNRSVPLGPVGQRVTESFPNPLRDRWSASLGFPACPSRQGHPNLAHWPPPLPLFGSNFSRRAALSCAPTRCHPPSAYCCRSLANATASHPAAESSVPRHALPLARSSNRRCPAPPLPCLMCRVAARACWPPPWCRPHSCTRHRPDHPFGPVELCT